MVQTLAQHVDIQRQCYKDLLEAPAYAKIATPTNQERIKARIKFDTSDPGVANRFAGIDADDGSNGKGSNFEKAATHLVEACPVQKSLYKKITGKIIRVNVSGACIAGRDPETGLDFSWYNGEKY